MRIVLIVSTLFIFALGLLMVFNTSSAEILDRFLKIPLHTALIKQIIHAAFGLACAFFCYKLGINNLIRLGLFLLALGTFLLLLVYVPGIGRMVNGSRRWIGFLGFTFQPSEFVKFFLLLGFLNLFFFPAKEEITFAVFAKMVAILAVPILLVMIEPDNGGAFVMGLSLLPLFFLGGIKSKYWLFPFIGCLILGVVCAYQIPYVRARIKVYLHPELDRQGKGHQPFQAKIAAGSGKLFGKGPGNSLQKLTYLPEAQNDYIAAIYAEEFGFLGMVLLLSLYMLFSFAGFAMAFEARSEMHCFLAAGITFLISLQAFLNLGVVSGLLPSKGVNLPFFSQGGTSLIVNMCMAACLLRIAKESEEKNALKTA